MSTHNALDKSNVPNENDYKHYDNRTHVYEKASFYISSETPVIRDEWLYDLESKKMKVEEIDYVQGCERIFLEPLSNASDNCSRSVRKGVDPGRIEITMDKQTISIKNYGLPIPIGLHPEEKVPVPQMLFGTVNTSSNYDGDRTELAGVFGIGAKATNIFSIKFEVYIENSFVKQSYRQIWENNMMICNDPITHPYKGKMSSTTITYTMDFKRFNYTEYPPEAFELFARHAADISFTAKVPVIFNGLDFNYVDIKEYARLYFGDKVEQSIIHTQNDLQFILMDTPDEAYQVSFVNCMMTKEHGVHVSSVFKAVGEPIVEMINEGILKQLKKLKLDAKELKTHTIKLTDVKPHLSLLLSCKLTNAEFKGNAKAELTKPTPKITLNDDVFLKMQSWELVKRLHAALDAKQYASLSKTDGKKTKFLKLLKGRDARFAGDTKSLECTLCVTEGKSGAGYINKMISAIEDGWSYYGVLPLKGKCLNAMNVLDKRIDNNLEFKNIKQMLGLKAHVDYTIPANFKTLRYGKFMICNDADKDGVHITALIINYFHCQFPSLLKVPGFLIYKKTPILRLSKGKKVHKFYTQRQFDVWHAKQKQIDPTAVWKVKYFKGLGTSLLQDVLDDIKDEHIVTAVYDEDAPQAIRLAFDKNLRLDRKSWILDWVERDDVDTMSVQPISLYINHELILFSISDLKRSIPKLSDGCKESHRKILAGSHKKFKIGTLTPDYKECRVADLDSFCSSETVYHHGTDILSKVITKMAQTFIGSNNINLFEPRGQFGDRYENGEDAASSRYIHTFPSVLFPYIFHKDDQNLLIPMLEEGQEIEPETYYPVIPMILINGSKGIGTGFSTFVPNHNPLDVINWLKLRLKGKVDLPTLVPWYRDFTGPITIIDRRKGQEEPAEYEDVPIENIEDSSDDEELEQKLIDERPLLSFVSSGIYHIKNNGTIVITELPIGRCPKQYYDKILVEKLLEKKIIKKIDNYCKDNTIHFELKGYVGNPSFKSLYLRKRYSLSNMVLLDKHDKPIRYDTSNDIIETYYNDRYVIYEKRKTNKMINIQNEIDKYQYRVKYINGILDKSIKIKNVEKQAIFDQLDKLNIPHEIYTKSKISNLNKEEVDALSGLINGLNTELNTLNKLTANDLWLNDLIVLEKKYKQVYKIK